VGPLDVSLETRADLLEVHSLMASEGSGASVSLAEPRGHGSIGDSSLVIQVKSGHKCKWTRVCDYFAPAESCSHPRAAKNRTMRKFVRTPRRIRALHRPARTASSAHRQTAGARRPARARASTYPTDPVREVIGKAGSKADLWPVARHVRTCLRHVRYVPLGDIGLP
jgi:hypothetical protein